MYISYTEIILLLIVKFININKLLTTKYLVQLIKLTFFLNFLNCYNEKFDFNLLFK